MTHFKTLILNVKCKKMSKTTLQFKVCTFKQYNLVCVHFNIPWLFLIHCVKQYRESIELLKSHGPIIWH